jgi:hypothetical protein
LFRYVYAEANDVAYTSLVDGVSQAADAANQAAQVAAKATHNKAHDASKSVNSLWNSIKTYEKQWSKKLSSVWKHQKKDWDKSWNKAYKKLLKHNNEKLKKLKHRLNKGWDKFRQASKLVVKDVATDLSSQWKWLQNRSYQIYNKYMPWTWTWTWNEKKTAERESVFTRWWPFNRHGQAQNKHQHRKHGHGTKH